MARKEQKVTLFHTENSHLKQQDAARTIFSNFFLLNHNNQLFIQLGLKQSFAQIDHIGADLSTYNKALQPIITLLEQLKLIPTRSNYILHGNDAVSENILNEANEYVLACNAKAGNYMLIELEQKNIEQLNRGLDSLAHGLKSMGLLKSETQYPIYETVRLTQPDTTLTPHRPGR